MALPTTITGISTAVACVGPYKATHVPLRSFVSGLGEKSWGDTSSQEKIAGEWTANYTGDISGITVDLGTVGSPTDNVSAEFHASTPDGTLLGTTETISGSALSATNALYPLAFSSPVSVTSGNTYYIVLKRSGAVNGTNHYSTNHGTETGLDVQYYNGTSWSVSVNDATLRASPYIAEGFYFFGRDGTTAGQIDAYKATDPTSSWSSVDTFTAAGFETRSFAGYQVVDVDHLIYSNVISGGTTVAYGYTNYDMSSETFLSAEGVTAAITSTGQTGVLQTGCSIVVRSNGDAVAFFNGAQTKKSGTNYARLYWSERTGVNTWSAAALVSAEDAADHIKPNAVLGVSDRVHFLWTAANGRPTHRSLSSANTLDTNSGDLSVGDTVPSLRGATSYDDGTVRIIFAYTNQSGQCVALNTDSGANPTWSASVTVELGALVSSPTRLFHDENDAYVLYAETDNDLYTEKSTDDGDTWGTKTLAFTATINAGEENLSHDGNIYQRGSDLVIPYVVNDNGTLKYNEYIVRTIVAAPNNGWIDDPWRANDVVAKRDFRALAYQ